MDITTSKFDTQNFDDHGKTSTIMKKLLKFAQMQEL